METEFADPDLQRLFTDIDFKNGLPIEIVKAFRKRMQMIVNAVDERDLYNVKGNHFEKLKGARSHQHSLRINDKMRLIVQIRTGKPKNTIVVVGMEDYH